MIKYFEQYNEIARKLQPKHNNDGNAYKKVGRIYQNILQIVDLKRDQGPFLKLYKLRSETVQKELKHKAD